MNATARKGGGQQGGPRSAARLAAVQALYQLEMDPDLKPTTAIQEYISHRLGAEIEGEQYVEADSDLFRDIVEGAWGRRAEIDPLLSDTLSADWPLDRLERLIRAVLRAGAYELLARPDVPTAVVITEYVDVAHAFVERAEARFVNGVLDRIARDVR
ncbi:transcription antitermination factor NusB [Yunchengibacter salinarum]|uniref:transcription antitermination factor NusB n=1 Tax=Yunchengibacter salinarum TaxID=3133399 RepID=UPI0035B5B96C